MTPSVRLKVLLIFGFIMEFPEGFLFDESEYEGSLDPVDPKVCTKMYLNFTCTLTSTPDANRILQFTVKTTSQNMDLLINNTHMLNESFAVFEYYFEKAETVVVKCFYLEKNSNPSDTYQLGETSMPLIYSMPQKVQNFGCVVKNYQESMNCSWDYGVTYIPPPTVVFEWRIPTLSGTWNKCPNLNTASGYCFWSNTSQGDFSLKRIEVHITLSQECKASNESNFTLDTTNMVKPDPVVDLTGTTVNSTCIHVMWNTTKQAYTKIHQANATSKWPNDTHQILYTTNKTTESEMQRWLLCGLQEDTVYTVSVGVKPNLEGFWSDFRTVQIKTYSDVPSTSPELGGYAWKPKDCEDRKEGRKRNVCIFWKPISKIDENGNMKGVDLNFTNTSSQQSLPLLSLSEDSTNGCTELNCNEDYWVLIKARNENGSSQASKIHILNSTAELTQPEFIVEMDLNKTRDKTLVTVTWDYEGAVRPDYFTVTMCRKFGETCQPNEAIQWYTVDGKENQFAIYLTSPDDFLYGVSAATAIGNSGNRWETCIYSRNISPSKEPQNVVVAVGANDNTLMVTWDKLTCEAGQPYIGSYLIEYCNGRSCKNTTALASDSWKELRDLTEDVKYTITVRGVTKNGLLGPASKPASGTPVNKSLTAAAVGGIVSAVLVGVILSAVGLVCSFRHCKKRVSKTITNAGKVTIPEEIKGLDTPVYDLSDKKLTVSTRTLDRQDSGDSGYDPMTPPVDKNAPTFVTRPDGYAVATTLPDGNCLSETRLSPDDILIEEVRNITWPSEDLPVIIVNAVHVGETVNSRTLNAIKLRELLSQQKGNDNMDNTAVKTVEQHKVKAPEISEGYSKATVTQMAERKDSVVSSSNQKSNVTVKGTCSVDNDGKSSAPDYIAGHMSPVSKTRKNSSDKPKNLSKEKGKFSNTSSYKHSDNNMPCSDLESVQRFSGSTNIPTAVANSLQSRTVANHSIGLEKNALTCIPCPSGSYVSDDIDTSGVGLENLISKNHQPVVGFGKYTNSVSPLADDITQQVLSSLAAQKSRPENISPVEDTDVYVSSPMCMSPSPVVTPSSIDPVISSCRNFPSIGLTSVKFPVNEDSSDYQTTALPESAMTGLEGTSSVDDINTFATRTRTPSTIGFIPKSVTQLLTSVPVPASTEPSTSYQASSATPWLCDNPKTSASECLYLDTPPQAAIKTPLVTESGSSSKVGDGYVTSLMRPEGVDRKADVNHTESTSNGLTTAKDTEAPTAGQGYVTSMRQLVSSASLQTLQGSALNHHFADNSELTNTASNVEGCVISSVLCFCPSIPIAAAAGYVGCPPVENAVNSCSKSNTSRSPLVSSAEDTTHSSDSPLSTVSCSGYVSQSDTNSQKLHSLIPVTNNSADSPTFTSLSSGYVTHPSSSVSSATASAGYTSKPDVKCDLSATDIQDHSVSANSELMLPSASYAIKPPVIPISTDSPNSAEYVLHAAALAVTSHTDNISELQGIEQVKDNSRLVNSKKHTVSSEYVMHPPHKPVTASGGYVPHSSLEPHKLSDHAQDCSQSDMSAIRSSSDMNDESHVTAVTEASNAVHIPTDCLSTSGEVHISDSIVGTTTKPHLSAGYVTAPARFDAAKIGSVGYISQASAVLGKSLVHVPRHLSEIPTSSSVSTSYVILPPSSSTSTESAEYVPGMAGCSSESSVNVCYAIGSSEGSSVAVSHTNSSDCPVTSGSVPSYTKTINSVSLQNSGTTRQASVNFVPSGNSDSKQDDRDNNLGTSEFKTSRDEICPKLLDTDREEVDVSVNEQNEGYSIKLCLRGDGYVDETFAGHQKGSVAGQGLELQRQSCDLDGVNNTDRDREIAMPTESDARVQKSDGYVDETFIKLTTPNNGVIMSINQSLAEHELHDNDNLEKDSDSGVSSLENCSPE